METLLPIKVCEAFCKSPAPCALPPMKTSPPPFAPLTSIFALSFNAIALPSMVTVPPVSPAFLPEAINLPVTVTEPAFPFSTTSPLTMPTDFASATPLILIVLSSTCPAALAVISTRPPFA